MILLDRAPEWTSKRPRYRVACYSCCRVLIRTGFPKEIRERRECGSCAARHRWKSQRGGPKPTRAPLWLRAAVAFGREVTP